MTEEQSQDVVAPSPLHSGPFSPIDTLEHQDPVDALLDVGARMAQELQDFVDEAAAAGSTLKGTQELIEEWEQLYRRFNE